MAILENIDKDIFKNIDIDKDILENIDIDKGILENIDIDKDILGKKSIFFSKNESFFMLFWWNIDIDCRYIGFFWNIDEISILILRISISKKYR